MSTRLDGVTFIFAEILRTCELCGKDAETRPYGPRGEQVCFACGMKNEPAAERQCSRVLLGEPVN